MTEAGQNLPRRLHMPVRDDWRKLAQAARDEQDPEKLMKLIERLNRELERRSRDLYPDSLQAAD